MHKLFFLVGMVCSSVIAMQPAARNAFAAELARLLALEQADLDTLALKYTTAHDKLSPATRAVLKKHLVVDPSGETPRWVLNVSVGENNI